jgi:hypothetical protein
MSNFYTAIVMGETFEFKIVDGDEDGDILCVWVGQWRDAFHYFSVYYPNGGWSVEELHAIANRITGVSP